MKPPDRPRPALPARSTAAMEDAMAFRAAVVRASLEKAARDTHGTLAELSSMAGLAAARLEQVVSGSGDAGTHLAAVKAMLLQVQNAGRAAYLAKGGTEADYQGIGAKVTKAFRTPAGRWRR